MTDIDPDTAVVLDALEALAERLIAELLTRDPGAAEAVVAALGEAIDGSPRRPGAWFRIRSGAVMARLVETWERLRRVAVAAPGRAGDQPDEVARP